MSAPFLLDLSHTSHTRARTGIQRVCRSLHTALGTQAVAVTHDPHAETWRLLEPWEQANLLSSAADQKRGAQWPLDAKLLGHVRRWLGGASDLSRRSDPVAGVIVPEVFSSTVAAALPALLAATTGPRVAIFHDAIALKFPELTPAKTVARFPAYLCELLAFDGIAAVSEDSRDSLLDYWRWLGATNLPRVEAIPLGVDSPANGVARTDSTGKSTPVILTVGSIEGRKNHVALLEACEQLWSRGAKFELRLVGLSHPQTGAAALQRIEALQNAGRPLRYDGPLGDTALDTAYAECSFTVYPSLIEGFGLPVIESLSHGKPCVCSGRGALGESARGGGCVLLDTPGAPQLVATIARLLEKPDELGALAGAARARKFKSWSDYARELVAWIQTVPRKG
jgi:glycosyltransferase involved in cell wall biosynthesis